MNREDLQNLARIRIREAKVLLDAECFAGSFYLAGYAIECALKACLAKQGRGHEFPKKNMAREIYTHDLEDLRAFAGLDDAFTADIESAQALQVNWSVVTVWNEQWRYEPVVERRMAADMYSACTTRTNGILPWIRKRW